MAEKTNPENIPPEMREKLEQALQVHQQTVLRHLSAAQSAGANVPASVDFGPIREKIGELTGEVRALRENMSNIEQRMQERMLSMEQRMQERMSSTEQHMQERLVSTEQRMQEGFERIEQHIEKLESRNFALLITAVAATVGIFGNIAVMLTRA